MAKSKYVLIKPVMGTTKLPVGSTVELTKAQAETPFYRNRVRPKDGEVALTPATPSATEEPKKEEPATPSAPAGGSPWATPTK